MSVQKGTKYFWQKTVELLKSTKDVILLTVVESKGSSPGRQGFKMIVSGNGDRIGSVGGGILEFNLVEHAKEKLTKKDFPAFIRKYFHSEDAENNKSGTICSGSQTVAMIYITEKDLITIESIYYAISGNISGIIQLSQNGISFSGILQEKDFVYEFNSPEDWIYKEKTGNADVLHIIGGGHCSLALSKVMKDLGFYIKVYDDRENLDTMNMNIYTDEKIYTSFDKLTNLINEGLKNYVVIMTFGHKSDGLALKQMLPKKLKYLGMMGSPSKVKEVFHEMKNYGFTQKELAKVYAPIGVKITSKTPEEIAISIAAEIIKIKNK